MKVINIMVIEILQKRSNCDISLLGGTDFDTIMRKVRYFWPQKCRLPKGCLPNIIA